MTSANIASHVPAMAKLDPTRKAIVAPNGTGGWRSISFGELDAQSDAYASGLGSIGIARGTRTVLMVPPSLEFFPLVFGLFKAGAVIVMIDPGIGRRALLKCLDEIEPQAFIGVTAAHIARILFPKPFRHVKSWVTVGPRLFWGGHTARQLLGNQNPFTMVEPGPNETAAILFTSGSTGIPKGVVYTHEMFDAQVRMIRQTYGIEPGEIDLPTFPLFALFDPALGMTAVLPEMDSRFPAKASAQKLVEAMRSNHCTMMFGSPALLDNLGRYCVENNITLPGLKRVLSSGAPVRNDVLERMAKVLGPEAQVFTPFGATEALPVASIGSHEVLRETAQGAATGLGICVGRPVEGTTVRIIRITDDAIENWSDDLEVPAGQIGEIAVSGPSVTREYFARPLQTKLAKIKDGAAVIHRMGDVGYFDEAGRLWMCGRKSHRLETRQGTLFTVPVEEIFNQHPAVKRTALVGPGERGRQHPHVLIEREPGTALTDEQLIADLKVLAAKHIETANLHDFTVYPGTFPVDARHNAKIEREKLTAWVAAR